MFWKILICLDLVHVFALGYYVPSIEDNDAAYENFKSLSINNAYFLKHSSKKQNIYYSPLVSQILDSMKDMKFCYTVASNPNNEYCQDVMNRATMLNSTLKTFTNNPHMTCNVSTIVLVDQQNQSFYDTFLKDATEYYNSEIIKTQFNSTDSLYEEINEWVFKKSKKPYPRIEHTGPLATSIELGILSFKACWDTPKILRKKKKKFTTEEGAEIDATMVIYKEQIAYHNFTDLKIEAISLPYKGKEFSVIVILPYRDEGLNAFSSFATEDYESVFSVLKSANLSLVKFEIPFLNSTSITFDNVGSIINEEYAVQVIPELVRCDVTRGRTFYVDRPYAMFIYHQKTSEILYSVFIRDPSFDKLYITSIDT